MKRKPFCSIRALIVGGQFRVMVWVWSRGLWRVVECRDTSCKLTAWATIETFRDKYTPHYGKTHGTVEARAAIAG